MQPNLLVDWLRKLDLKADSVLAGRRWQMAESFAANGKRTDCIHVLRGFLFVDPPQPTINFLTTKFLELDKEFPASNNVEDCRLASGLAMLAAVEVSSPFAIAAALGMVAASFPPHRSVPYLSNVSSALTNFMGEKAEALRPSKYSSESQVFNPSSGSTPRDVMPETSATATDSKKVSLYENQIMRLSEEIGLLWWLMGEYSTTLNKDIREVDSSIFALVAATEAASRTFILPPPLSIHSIINRVVSRSKVLKKKKSPLKDFISVTEENWRQKYLSDFNNADCLDLTPISTSLRKFDDTGDIMNLSKVVQKVCPNFTLELTTSENDAANQFFNEIVFLRSLMCLQ